MKTRKRWKDRERLRAYFCTTERVVLVKSMSPPAGRSTNPITPLPVPFKNPRNPSFLAPVQTTPSDNNKQHTQVLIARPTKLDQVKLAGWLHRHLHYLAQVVQQFQSHHETHPAIQKQQSYFTYEPNTHTHTLGLTAPELTNKL